MTLYSSSEANQQKSVPVARHASRFHVLQAEALSMFLFMKTKLAHRKTLRKKKIRGIRQPSLFLQRLNWEKFVAVNGDTPTFRRHIRMDYESFKVLLGFIHQPISINYNMADLQGGAIIPEI